MSFFLEYAKDIAESSSNNGQEGRIVSILYTLVDHKDLASLAEHMSNIDEISRPVQTVVRFIDLVDQS